MMMPVARTHETRAWLSRIALSFACALLVGLVVYLLARAISSVTLFIRHQDLLREMATALRSGLDGLAAGDVRAARRLLQQLDTRNERISLLVSFVAAGLASVGGYLWLERRAIRTEENEQP